MILVDTSIWIDHIHRRDAVLVALLNRSSVVRHPMVVGELAMGNLKNRTVLLAAMRGLPIAPVATHDEVSQLIEIRVLYGRGLSLIDAHLLASVLLAPGTLLWTRDRRLRDMAEQFGVEYST